MLHLNVLVFPGRDSVSEDDVLFREIFILLVSLWVFLTVVFVGIFLSFYSDLILMKYSFVSVDCFVFH